MDRHPTTSRPSAKDVVVQTNAIYRALKQAASAHVRKRTLHALHASHDAELHTMINVFERGSYSAPHMHWIDTTSGAAIRKGESFLALEGTGRIVLLDDAGIIDRIVPMGTNEHTMVWIPAGVWHTVVATSPYFIVFENKTGPWNEGEDKRFHPQFPKEGESQGAALVKAWESLPISPFIIPLD